MLSKVGAQDVGVDGIDGWAFDAVIYSLDLREIPTSGRMISMYGKGGVD